MNPDILDQDEMGGTSPDNVLEGMAVALPYKPNLLTRSHPGITNDMIRAVSLSVEEMSR